MVKLYKLFILQRNSGLCIIDATLGEFPNDTDQNGLLISGLLTSFMHFTNHIIGEEIRLFETKSFRIVFSLTEELIVAIIMDRKGPVQIAEKILERLKKLFTKHYAQEIKRSFSGDISGFSDFEKKIEEVTQLKGIKLIRHMMQKGKQNYAAEIKRDMEKFIQWHKKKL